ncbi:MAG: 6-phospho-3-hexuloisomerase [Methanosarcinales archaeon]|nr:MAG: 6-phospho-3-hexuloisomerase [Methanosarcinales archaeon]
MLDDEGCKCENLIFTMNLIAGHVKKMSNDLDIKSVSKLVCKLVSVKKNLFRVFIMGAGRSGLVGSSFAMRLMHLGFTVFVVGETTTPAVHRDDIVIAISGSGETPSIISLGKITKDISATLIAITSNPHAALAGMSDITVKIRGRTGDLAGEGYLERHMKGKYRTLTPMGTTFEVSTMIFLDSVIAELMVLIDATEADLKKRHSVFD